MKQNKGTNKYIKENWLGQSKVETVENVEHCHTLQQMVQCLENKATCRKCKKISHCEKCYKNGYI